MGKKITYTEAFSELQVIVTEIENEEIGIDLLESRIKRASELLKICRDKLYKTEKSVTHIFKEIKEYPQDL
ncbi:MAG TPA: exodeoxyribonuclease VII small subunit [Gillisia sp.]|nr:exodeoxyribonuclease VII small subunit [Gillisia sp.]